MSPQRRPRSPARSSRPRAATFFLGIGGLVVLVVTFVLGMAAGRRWPDGLPGFGSAPAAPAVARSERETPKRPEARGLDKEKAKPRTETAMTFYHELTAPMASLPPPTRGAAKPEAPKPAPRPPATVVPAPDAIPRQLDTTVPTSAAASAATGESRFTVQVGSFKARAQAEALRARLGERGQEAYVTEVEVSGAPQYRVRVGSFATREAARDAATRLGGEGQVAPYVTTR